MYTEWQRPQTTRRYIHPPKAERMFTIWKEGKIVFGETTEPITARYEKIISCGIWFTDGDGNSSDFRTAENILREDGIPVHGLKNKLGEMDYEIECFSSFERCPTCYIKVSVKNNSADAKKFGFLLRTGREDALILDAPDVYAPYNPDVAVWKALPSTFSYDGEVFRDGEYYLTAHGFEWDAEKGIAAVKIEPAKEKTFVLALGKGEAADFDYDAEMEKSINSWLLELAKINKLPESIKSNPEFVKTIQHLTIQMLQCFSMAVGSDNLYPRQGGLQRRIWTGEAWMMIEAMCRIGDFSDYLDPVMELYFNEFQTESGEMVPFGISWAMATATVLFTYAKYAMSVGKAVWDKYSEKAFKASEWIRNTRVKEDYRDDKGCLILKGLLPPLRSCDDELVFQGWTVTDASNLFGLEAYVEAAEYFGDVHAKEIRDGYEDYLNDVRGYWNEIVAKAGDSNEIEVPYAITIPNEELHEKFFFRVSGGRIVYAVDAKREDAERVLNQYKSCGRIKGGLYGRMKDIRRDVSVGSGAYNLDENGKCVVWYVCSDEYMWFKTFMRWGDRERAEEIIRDNFKFAMTDEYYMLERYNQRDPYFGPWMPNASANGRTINMLLDFYA